MPAESSDFLILGGGTAGCVLADRLSESGSSVILVEAGPDYGPFGTDSWPQELVDPREPCNTHDWYPDAEFSLSRARVIGGCSAHNACFVTRGDRNDYDEWGEFAPGWDLDSLRPYLDRGASVIGARLLEGDEIPPWAPTVHEAAVEAGLQGLEDFNDETIPEGVGYLPLNVRDSARWSTAFAYLDRARARDNLTVLGEALVDRVLLDGERATGAIAIVAGSERKLEAGTVILSAGAFGSPGILLRSGIGPVDDLEGVGIAPAAELTGVGANLLDHSGVNIVFGAAPEMAAKLRDGEAGGRMFGNANMIRAASSACPEGTWDIHLVPWAAHDTLELTGREWRVQLSPYVMKSRSTGSVRLRSPSPDDPLNVDLGFLSDPDDSDLGVLVEGIELVRRIAATQPFASATTDEAVPGPAVEGRYRIAAWARANVRGYFHPVGTCRFGAFNDPGAVVDADCRVHGIAGLHVVDASVMPTIPRANTNLTTIAIAERIAEGLLA
jgi:choline dehydrogenase-like flavoprotein